MKDPDNFTVDHPGFSTQRVIGPSMLSLDGPEHRRHRDPFRVPFRASAIRDLTADVTARASRLVGRARAAGSGDLRADVAAPLSVEVMTRLLGLAGVHPGHVLQWYTDIVDAVHTVTFGGEVPLSGRQAYQDLRKAVVTRAEDSSLLAPIVAGGNLTEEEIASNVAVLLFGGIVTTESSIAIAYRYLLESPALAETIDGDRSKVDDFVEETFRLEPSAAVVDRYATRDVDVSDVTVRKGDLVRVSLSAANRDPAVFEEPDVLRLNRPDRSAHVTFARGPHICLGIHLARLEVSAAVEALLDHRQGIAPRNGLDPVEGLVFRAPRSVDVVWV